MKNLLIFGLTIIMIFFKTSSQAEYEKIFFDFKINSISGDIIDLNEYKGKPVLVVNTASYCGFTKQYEDMQKLWENYREKGLIVLGIPSNSFNQEMLKVMMHMKFINGPKIIMVNLLFQNGIFIKY